MKRFPLSHLRLARSWLLLASLTTGIATAAIPSGQPQGVDTSHHNTAVNWATLHDNGVRFVFIKATDGKDYLDPAFADSFRIARESGLLRGAYHFYETDDDGVAQAQWFIRNVDLQPGDLPPVVDIERVKAPVDGDLHTQFDAFLSTLEAHYGQAPIIYTGPNFWDHAMQEHFPDHPLWVAQYNVSAPTLPDGWSTWTFWQYTENWQPPGTTTPIDGSVFNGDETKLQALLISSPGAAPASEAAQGAEAP